MLVTSVAPLQYRHRPTICRQTLPARLHGNNLAVRQCAERHASSFSPLWGIRMPGPHSGQREGPALRSLAGESHSLCFCWLSGQPRPCPDASDLPGLRLLRSLPCMRRASGLGLLRSRSRVRAFFRRLLLLRLSPCLSAGLLKITPLGRVHWNVCHVPSHKGKGIPHS